MPRLALFGTGAQAEMARAAIAAAADASLVAVADNAPARQGTEWHGHVVLSAEALAASPTWEVICVASQWYADIVGQLAALGVPATRIAIFQPGSNVEVVPDIPSLRRVVPLRGRAANAEAAPPIPGFEEDYDRLVLLQRLGFNPRAVLDVGASNGPWSETCARVFPDANYYLVEPLPHYESQLIAVPTSGTCHRLPVALGSEDGEATISIPRTQWGAFGATMLDVRGATPGAETVRVPLRRLDTLLAAGTIEPPQLVKLDVQGYEAAVLAGGERLWQSAEAFFVELSMDRFWAGSRMLHEMIALFDARGFLAFDFFHELRVADGVLAQIDVVFLRRDGELARTRHLWRHAAA
jgi:FkbM family methyltransferase